MLSVAYAKRDLLYNQETHAVALFVVRVREKKMAVQNALATLCYWSIGLGQEGYELSLLGDMSHLRTLQAIDVFTGSKHGDEFGKCLLHLSWQKKKMK